MDYLQLPKTKSKQFRGHLTSEIVDGFKLSNLGLSGLRSQFNPMYIIILFTLNLV